MSVRFYDYSVVKSYHYEDKSPCITTIEKMIKPFSDVFGARVVDISKMEIGLMASTTKKILYIFLLIAALPYTLFCAICLLIKYIAEPPSKILEILRLQMKKRESEIIDFIKAFQFEQALDLLGESKGLINPFSQHLVRKEYRRVLRKEMQGNEDAKARGDVPAVLKACSRIDRMMNPRIGNLADIGLKESEIDFINEQNILDKNYEWALGLIREVPPLDFDQAESICKLCVKLSHKHKLLDIYLKRVISHLYTIEDVVGVTRVCELLYNVMGMDYLTSEEDVFKPLLTGVLSVVEHERNVRNLFRVMLKGLLNQAGRDFTEEETLTEIKLCMEELESYTEALSSIKKRDQLELIDTDYFDMAFMVDVGALGGLEDFVIDAIKACEERTDNPSTSKQLCESFSQLWGIAQSFAKTPEIGKRRKIFKELSGLNLNHETSQGRLSRESLFPLDHEKLREHILQELDDQLLEDAQSWLCMVQSVFQQAVDLYNAGGASESGLVTDVPVEIQKALRSFDYSIIP